MHQIGLGLGLCVRVRVRDGTALPGAHSHIPAKFEVDQMKVSRYIKPTEVKTDGQRFFALFSDAAQRKQNICERQKVIGVNKKGGKNLISY